jgi:hypothetical protein
VHNRCARITQDAFGKIMGNRNGLGQVNEAVLVQVVLPLSLRTRSLA